MTARTLYDKIWDDHVVDTQPDGTCLLYIDRHLVHEVTSPQAFEGLRMTGRKVRHPEKTLAVVDHNVPTTDRSQRHRRPGKRDPGRDAGRERPRFRRRVLRRARPPPGHRPHHRPGAGLHPARHDHRLRRQPHLDARRLRRARPRHRHLRGRARARHPDADPEEGQEHAGHASTARCRPGVTAKDIILAIIGEIGTAGGTGHVIEYAGEAIRALSMEGRMTVCNMSIEGGARAGLIAPDEKTFAYLKGRPKAPKGAAWDEAHALLGDAALRRRRAFRPRGPARRREAAADRHLGHEPGGRRLDQRRRAEPGRRSPTRTSAPRSSARSTIWASSPAPGSPTSRSSASSSAPAPMAASRICAPSPRSSRAAASTRRQRHGRAGLRPREGAGRGRGPRQDLHRGRLRLARAGLLDVPRHERRQARRRRSAAPRPRTAISRAARASRAAPTSSRRPWRRRRRSPAASSISAPSR